MPKPNFSPALSVALRVERFESRSSPALIWTGWDALDPSPTVDGTQAPTAPTAQIYNTGTTGESVAPAPAETTAPVAPISPPGAVVVQPTIVPDAGHTDATDGKPFTYTDSAPEGGKGGGTLQGQAPEIVNFSASYSSGIWVFSGTVIDDTPAGLTVSLGGAPASLQGVTATTDANGYFSKGVILQTNGSDSGTATAKTVDPDGNPSNTAMVDVNP